jgi:hypothetical protein
MRLPSECCRDLPDPMPGQLGVVWMRHPAVVVVESYGTRFATGFFRNDDFPHSEVLP